jgi:uncharacterized protein (TIGR03086 family)
MSTRDHLDSVVATLQPVVRAVPDEMLEAPTPCAEFDVRAVANHMLGTIEAMRRVGASEALDPDDPWGTNGDNVTERWREELGEKLSGFAQAWSDPAAWEGDAMGGAMPKQLIGDMGFVEVVLHGWDLARGSGQEITYDVEAITTALAVMEQIGEQGRSMRAFGPEVPLPHDASAFEQVLAKAGRNPGWSTT